MRGDRLRESLSAYFDGELPDEARAGLEEILASSEEARIFVSGMDLVRGHLRRPDAGPDVTGSVIEAIARQPVRRPRRKPRLAVAFATGVVVGAVFIGVAVRQPAPVAAADIPDRVLAAQSQVTSLRTRLLIVERGWHPEVPERVFTGNITYQAPESLWVEIRDDSSYPTEEWVPNHTRVVVDRDMAWSQSTAACPTEALPGCTPSDPRVKIMTGREPFPEDSPAPLDLIVPVGGFVRAGEPTVIGLRVIDGRRSLGVEVTAAQVAALIDGLTGVGNWREVHPTDRVELWLDQQALVPLAFSVFPSGSPDRRLWAIRRGYHDTPDVAVLEVTWADLTVGDLDPIDFPEPPPSVAPVDAGFSDHPPADLETLTPTGLPEGMTRHRSGTIGPDPESAVYVASWSDGRSWVKLRWTGSWAGSRLFGDLGDLVRQVPIGSGVGYVNQRGDKVALHGDGLDLVLMGSLPTDDLVSIAESLGISGRAVPGDWIEAATATVGEARSAVPGLLLPGVLEGFGDPAIRVETGLALVSYAGPGNRAFLLTQAVDGRLSPPLESNVRGVSVRGIDGRYSPDRGLLEWVEGDLVIGMASLTLSLDELVAIAESLDRR